LEASRRPQVSVSGMKCATEKDPTRQQR